MVPAPSKFPPELFEQVKQLAEDRQWKPSHAIRFLVTKGLEHISSLEKRPAETETNQPIAA